MREETRKLERQQRYQRKSKLRHQLQRQSKRRKSVPPMVSSLKANGSANERRRVTMSVADNVKEEKEDVRVETSLRSPSMSES